MQIFLWLAVLFAAVLGMDWGADRIADPLKKLRQHLGITQAAGAAFVALATASPEALINTVSALRGSEDIGFGNMLGSNILSVPGIVTVAYIASRTSPLARSNHEGKRGGDYLVILEPQGFSTQAIPYVLVVLLVAALTIPEPWRGLQPIDGWLVLGAYIVCVANAILQGRTRGQKVKWEKKGIILAIGGAIVLAASALLAVTATEHLAIELKISEAIAGLFITSTTSILPELFATWHLAKSGQEGTAATAVCADNTLTFTLGLFPLTTIWLPIKPEDFNLFCVNMAAVLGFAVLAAVLMYRGSEKYSFSLNDVAILCGTYIIYVVAVLFGVLKIFS